MECCFFFFGDDSESFDDELRFFSVWSLLASSYTNKHILTLLYHLSGSKYAQYHIQRDKHLRQGEDKSCRHNQQCKKNEIVHINRLKDDRWTSRVTSWRPFDKKRRQGRPAKRWRDDLDKYWRDTIWQRTAQDRLTWRWHADAFAQPRDTTAAQR